MYTAILYVIMMLALNIYVAALVVMDIIESKKKKKFTWFDYEWTLSKDGEIIVHWDKLRHSIEWYERNNYDMESLI